MRAFLVAAMVALTAAPAFSQGMPGAGRLEGRSVEEQQKEDATKRANSAEAERAARQALDRTYRDQPQKPHDPWGSIRSVEPAKNQKQAR